MDRVKIFCGMAVMIIFLGCVNKQKKEQLERSKKERIDSIRKDSIRKDSTLKFLKKRDDSIANIAKLKKDSITKIYEKIAIGKINFGITKKQFKKKKKEFLKSIDNKLGIYYVYQFDDSYRNGGLYRISINYGGGYNDRSGLTSAREAYNFMRSILDVKYEDIKTYTHEYDFPYWGDFSEGNNYKTLCVWEIGDKRIWLGINRSKRGYSYEKKYGFRLSMSIMFETQEDRDRLKKDIKRIQKEAKDEERKSINKAIDAL